MVILLRGRAPKRLTLPFVTWATTNNNDAAKSAILSGADRVIGSEAADRMQGYTGKTRWKGAVGEDHLRGDEGDDSIVGRRVRRCARKHGQRHTLQPQRPTSNQRRRNA